MSASVAAVTVRPATEADHGVLVPVLAEAFSTNPALCWFIPDERRRTALLRPMLERCDAERMPAYLNASTARSRDLYARNGFEVRSEFRLPFGGPPLWRMWRPA